MKRLSRIFFLILGIIFLAGPSSARIVDKIVAIVNDQVITLSELEKATQKFLLLWKKQNPSLIISPMQRKEIEKQVLNQMINNLLVDQEVKRLKIEVTDEEISRFIEELKKKEGLSQEDLLRSLKKQGLSWQDYKKNIGEQIKRIKLIQARVKERIVITDEDIKAYYQKRYSNLPRQYFLAAIITKGPKAKDKIFQAWEELKKGEPFIKVAQKFSSVPGSGKGLGSFTLEELSPQIRKVIKQLKPGEVSSPVKIGASWEIFLLIKKEKSPAPPLSQEKEKLKQELYQQKVDQLFKKWILELRKNSYIKIFL